VRVGRETPRKTTDRSPHGAATARVGGQLPTGWTRGRSYSLASELDLDVAAWEADDWAADDWSA